MTLHQWDGTDNAAPDAGPEPSGSRISQNAAGAASSPGDNRQLVPRTGGRQCRRQECRREERVSQGHPPKLSVEDVLRVLHEPGEVFEVRILNAGRSGTVSGYFDDPGKAATEIAKWDGKVPGVYVTLNPVSPALLARSENRLRERARDTTSDRDIVRRTWLLIDVDVERPAGISSTKEELRAAGTLARLIKAFLEDECGWARAILVASGNGAHLLFRIDLPNNNASRDLVKRLLSVLAEQFDEGGAHVDVSVHNSARIAKIPGTMACKGDSTAERPHRRSMVLECPDELRIVTAEQLAALAGTAKAAERVNTIPYRGGGSGTPFDVESFIQLYDLVVKRHKQLDGGDLWELAVCPFNPDHDTGSAFIRRAANGALAAGCHHNSCEWGWHDLRERYEPGYRERRPAARDATDENGEPLPAQLVQDAAHAEVLATCWRGVYRWALHERAWRWWTGQVWKRVDDSVVANAAQKLLREHYAQFLAQPQSAAEDRRFRDLHKASCRYANVLGALAFLRGEPGFHTEFEEWDSDPYTLNTADGLLDLSTQTLRPHDPAALCTKITAWGFVAEGTGAWERHLLTWLPDDDVRRQVQRDLGRALVGADLEESLAIWYGVGANGKSTTTNAILKGVGEYGKQAAKDLLVASKFERHTTDLADLAGSRVVIAEEIEDGKSLDEATVKNLTGGNRKKARFMRGDNFEFEQTFSIFLLVNHRPQVAGTDKGIWRRLRLVPWTGSVTFAQQLPQDEVVAELMRDGAWMLRWMVAGFADWQADPHWVAEAVEVATAAYRAEQDVLAGFLSRRCVLNPHASVPVTDLYEAYLADVAENGDEGVEPLTKIVLSNRLKNRGLTQSRNTKGSCRIWQGIGLLTGSDEFSASPRTKPESENEPETLSEPVSPAQGSETSSGSDSAHAPEPDDAAADDELADDIPGTEFDYLLDDLRERKVTIEEVGRYFGV